MFSPILVLTVFLFSTSVDMTRPPDPPKRTGFSRFLGQAQTTRGDIKPRVVAGLLVWSNDPLTADVTDQMVAASNFADDLAGGPALAFGVVWVADDIRHYRVMLHKLWSEAAPGRSPDRAATNKTFLDPETGVSGASYWPGRSQIVIFTDYPRPRLTMAAGLSHEVAHLRFRHAFGMTKYQTLSRDNMTFNEGIAQAVAVLTLPEVERSKEIEHLAAATRQFLDLHRERKAFEAAIAEQVSKVKYDVATAMLLAAIELREADFRRLMLGIRRTDDPAKAVRLSRDVLALADHETLKAWCVKHAGNDKKIEN